MRTFVPLLLTLAVPGLALSGVVANHAQNESGRLIVFDHRTGNEWWVEVTLSGQDAGSVSLVEAMDTGGSWVPLQKKSWGPWAASFHIEPGHQVRFRATWAGGAEVTSCWFTHPTGVEQCPTPPSPWRTTVVGEAGLEARRGDMAVSDVDNDGRSDVTVANDNGLRVFEWTGSSWEVEVVSTRPLHALAVGSADGDLFNDAYALSWGTLYAYRRFTTGWDEQPLLNFPEGSAADMSLGDFDGIPGPELYLGLYDTTCDDETQLCSSTSGVYRAISMEQWEADRIASLAGHVDSLWVGDGDRDGTTELYVGHGTRHADRATQIRRSGETWQATDLPGWGSEAGMALAVVGDGDRDGKSEVYVANWYGNLRKLTFTSSGWVSETVFAQMRTPDAQAVNPNGLFLGDADSDGSRELYIAAANGRLIQVRWTGSAWQLTVISQPTDPGRVATTGMVVVGDGDGDGRREAYFSVSFRDEDFLDAAATRIYKVDVPASLFDATFTAVRGNEWWIQTNVAAIGGTLAKVDVRLAGGDWRPLTRQSWGAWAASYRAPEGTVVQFRATSVAGATDLSDCYRWIPPSNAEASKVSCGSTVQPFDAAFSGVKGNEWWVEVRVGANERLAGVDARVNCGSWVALDFHSWGAWAKSFHVPSGAKVDFRARSQTGATDVSGGYVWPQATPTSGC